MTDMPRIPVLVILVALLSACASPTFPVRIDGIDLIRTDPERTVLFQGVEWSSDRPAADVLIPRELVEAKYRLVAAVVFAANHRDVVIVIDATVPGTLRFSDALTAPMGARAEFTPDGRSLIVSCERDLAYGRPENVGSLRVPFSSLTWRDHPEEALAARDDRWSRRDVSGE
jgi:hypothetical protein